MNSDFTLIPLADEVTFQGVTFCFANVRIQDGNTPGKAAGYVFRPAQLWQPPMRYEAFRDVTLPGETGFGDAKVSIPEVRVFQSAAEREDFLKLADPAEGWDVRDVLPDQVIAEFGEYFCPDAKPTFDDAVANIPSYCSTPPAPPVAPVPEWVTRRQMLLALDAHGIFADDVETVIKTLVTEPVAQRRALLEFRTASGFDRLHPITQAVGAAYGVSIDDIYREAVAL